MSNDHGHEKPEVKEWAYIEGKWLFNDNGYFINQGGYRSSFYSNINIKRIIKSVTMPDWVPDLSEKTHSNSDKEAVPKTETGDKPANKYKVLCNGVEIDVYDILLAYAVTNPADQHAIKKMLMPGKRGVKNANQDRKEAIQSLERAIELATASE